ncbi:Uncharacterized protein C12orf26 [Trachymyrmex cornetzi]|uniref:Uncharacterized protein C12orf26 n=1 Tax=Trachymyrmex cornetzi TaxID=471704 RepID=A0A151J3J7_9HYME|nr:Uncharacterized protein C12orf26 [Trachymyrmex cornetzi]
MITEYNQHFEKALDFINIYQELIDCHLVDFITEGLWDKCLPEKLRSELENINMNDDIWAENNIDSELSSFIQLTKSLSLESCPAVICVNDLPKLLPQSSMERLIENKFVYPKSELMNTKKSHEIEVLGKVIAEIALSTRSLVIDAGAGKAYLSTYLSEHFNIPVLAIDSSQVCHKGAISRQEKIQKRKRTLTKRLYIILLFIITLIPPTYVLQEIYQNHIHFESRLRLFQMLRIYMSSVVEAAIMLDRIIFLQNNIKCSKVAVIRLFDPTLSPRCYGIIATK